MATEPESFRVWVAGLTVATIRQLRAARSPVTGWLLVAVAVVFVVQVVSSVESGVSLRAMTTYLFYARPQLAWPLSVFLHRGPLHVTVNVVLVGFLGRLVEGQFTTRAYASFLGVSAVASVGGGVAVIAAFGNGPIAAYGASGVGFALAGYALHYSARTDPSPGEWLAVIVGVAAVVAVFVDVATGPFFEPGWFNGAHVAGVAVGVLAGRMRPPDGGNPHSAEYKTPD